MARKKSLDELDEEMERLEAELRALEQGEALPDEGSEADEPEGGGGLLGRFKRDKGDKDEAEEADAPDDDGDTAGGLLGRFKRKKGEDADEVAHAEQGPPAEATEEEAPDADEAGAAGGLLGRFKRQRGQDVEAHDDAPAGAAQETEPTEAPGEAPGSAADEPPATEPTPEPEPARRARPTPPPGDPARWARTDEGWRRRSSEEEAEVRAALPDDEENDRPQRKAASLLARFRSREEDEDEDTSTSDEDEGAVLAAAAAGAAGTEALYADEGSEDDERRRKPVWLWLLLALLGIVLIGAIAAILLADDDGVGGIGGGGGELSSAFTVANALQGDGAVPLVVTNEPAEFDAGESTGEIDEYRWDFGDGRTTTTEGPEATHFYASRGEVTVTLTIVSGGDEASSSQTLMVVEKPQAAPVILVGGSAVASPGTVGNNAFVGQAVTLDGTGSEADPDHPIQDYSWDVDEDGTPDATGESASYTFTEEGMYMVFLTVTDDLGNTDTANFMVHVAGRTTLEGTAEASIPQETVAEHPVTVDQGRQMTSPVQVTATLSYAQPAFTVQSDLDLVLVDAAGNEFTAPDDEGAGNETLTLTGADLAERGQWTVRVVHALGDPNAIEYTVVFEVYH